MSVPTILSGAAGRAIDDLARVRSAAATSGQYLRGVVGDGPSIHSLDAFDDAANPATLRALLDDAGPGLRRAFGTTERYSDSIADGVDSLDAARRILTTDAGATAKAVARNARMGMADANAIMADIDEALPGLRSAALQTAAFRVTAGALGVGGAVAGITGLATGDS